MRKLLAGWLVGLAAAFCGCGGIRAQPSDNGAYKVGVPSRHVLPGGPYDWRGAASHALQEVLWYPAENGAEPKPQLIPPVGPAVFTAAPAAPEAKIAAQPSKLPLILLSHGTGGTPQSLAWLATALAARGYIVAAVDHPGNNALEPHTVPGFSLWWLRAKDLSAVLDDVFADPDFGPRVDPRRIGAAGFSLGGYTVIELAGGVTSRLRLEQSCRTTPDPKDCTGPPEFPDLVAKIAALAAADPAFAKALRGDGASYRDKRIRAVFAIAPALGGAVTPNSLRAISLPVAIVAGEQDSVVPIATNARAYAAAIPHAQLTILPGGVDHYTFLDVCTDYGRQSAPQSCNDRPGVDRAAVHDATIDLAVTFFGRHLRP